MRRRDFLRAAALASVGAAALTSQLGLAAVPALAAEESPAFRSVALASAALGADAAAAPAERPALRQAERPDQALVLESGHTLTGHLEPGPRGHFAYYKFEYPGDGSAFSINLHVTPDRPEQILQRIGFNVYGREPGRVYATSGTQPGMYPNISGDLINGEPGLFTVQVYSYDPTTPIDFEITGIQNDPPPE